MFKHFLKLPHLKPTLKKIQLYGQLVENNVHSLEILYIVDEGIINGTFADVKVLAV